jgi:hypothetical protein
MKTKNSVAAVLAVTVLLGFLGVIVALIFKEIPTVNKDFFNTALIALVGLVGTAFGFYLGSSYGSFVKTNAGSSSPALEPTPTPGSLSVAGNGEKTGAPGFAVVPLLKILFVIAVFCIFIVMSGGCASLSGKNETPESLAAKSLLLARQGIIASAETVDTLCTQGIMKQDACDQARKIYVDAQPVYTATSDAFLLYMTSKDDASRQRYEAMQPRLMSLFTDLDALVKKYGTSNAPKGGQ